MDRIVEHDHPAGGVARCRQGHRQGRGIHVSAAKSHDGKPADITPEQRKQVQRTSRNARQAMRVARRLGRF
jgi:hypothetical protein